MGRIVAGDRSAKALHRDACRYARVGAALERKEKLMDAGSEIAAQGVGRLDLGDDGPSGL